MPQPTLSQVHTNSALTDVSVAYIQNPENFVANKVFPTVSVENASDVYYIWSLADFMRDEAQERAPATESAGVGAGLTTGSYSAKVYAAHYDLADQIRANCDPAVDPEVAGAELVAQKLLLKQEAIWASNYFVSGVWTTDTTPATKWDASTNGDPLALIEAGKTTILKNTGFVPNTLTIGYDVFSALRKNTFVKDQFKYTSADSISEDMLAKFFDLDRVFVAKSVKNTAAKGASHSGAHFLTDAALLSFTPSTPALMTPAAGYTFRWTGYTGGQEAVIGTFRMDHLKAERIEGETAFDMKAVGSALGYFMYDVLT